MTQQSGSKPGKRWGTHSSQEILEDMAIPCNRDSPLFILTSFEPPYKQKRTCSDWRWLASYDARLIVPLFHIVKCILIPYSAHLPFIFWVSDPDCLGTNNPLNYFYFVLWRWRKIKIYYSMSQISWFLASLNFGACGKAIGLAFGAREPDELCAVKIN